MTNDAQVFLAGYVATDPVYWQNRDGNSKATLRVAYTPRYLDRSTGEWTDSPTSFVTVICWRKLADNVALCLRKGEPVLVRGRLQVRRWDDQQGRPHINVDVDAQSIGHDLARGVALFQRTRRVARDAAPDAAAPDAAGLGTDSAGGPEGAGGLAGAAGPDGGMRAGASAEGMPGGAGVVGAPGAALAQAGPGAAAAGMAAPAAGGGRAASGPQRDADGPGADGSAPDGSAPDGSAPDGSAPDGSAPDGRDLDGPDLDDPDQDGRDLDDPDTADDVLDDGAVAALLQGGGSLGADSTDDR